MKPQFALLATLIGAVAPALAVPVTVVVVGPDKKPLPDAHLEVFDKIDEKSKAASREINGTEGRFSFNWNGKFAPPTALPKAATALDNVVFVRASAPGLATQIKSVDKNAAVIELGARRAWSGLILDQNQKPIVGAHVATATFFVPIWESETKTDENGRWQLDDLPAQGTLAVKVSAPKYISASYQLDLDNETAPPIFLKLGANIRGQIVTPDGKPIENVPVVAGYEYENVARTDKEGRFELNGVEPDEISLMSLDIFNRRTDKKPADVGYLIPNFEKVRAVAGETTDIGQWKASRGAIFTVRAVDEATNKPVANAAFNLMFSNFQAVKADAQGVMKIRKVPDRSDNYPFLGSVGAQGYISVNVPRRSLQPINGQVDLGTVKLRLGNSVKGVIRAQGATTPDNKDWPTLSLGEVNQSTSIYFRGDTNEFETATLKAGNYKLAVEDASWAGQPKPEWQLVSPQTLTIPAPGVAGKPVEIVVKRLKPRAVTQSLREARGQILDENGQGVGGSLVNVHLTMGQYGSEMSALTGNDGRWYIKSFPANFVVNAVELQSIARPGYFSVGKASSAVQDGVALVSGVSMKRLGGVFAGRVVGTNGKSAAGAWVGVAELERYPLAQTDKDGRFEMRDLPLDKFTLLAAKEGEFARLTSDNQTKNLEIQLKPNAKFDREAAVQSALTGNFEWWRISEYWDYLGSERMGELAARGGEHGDWSRYRYALELAQREPKTFGVRAAELTRGLDDEQKTEIEAEWNWARAQAPDAAEKIALNIWVDAQKASKRAINAENVMQLLRVAAVAHRLGRKDVDDLSDYAAAIAAQVKPTANQAEGWGSWLAKSGYERAQSFVEGMKPVPEFKLWWTATGAIAQTGDIAGAQKAVARMEILAATPDWIELAAKESWNNPSSQVEQVRAQIARELAKTDLDKAQKLAASIEEQSNRTETSLVVADRALKANQPKVAEAALRVAMQSTYGNPEPFALAASLAEQVSPQLGAELWPAAYLRALPTKPRENDRNTFWPSIALWAFYHARLDAGQSRILLEREWNFRLAAAVKASVDEKADVNESIDLDRLIMAMGAIDPARALEMRAQAAREAKIAASKANVGLAAVLLMNEAQRINFGVDSRLF